MAVKIGSARIDEKGNATGGKAGDQNGIEVSTQNWYAHSKGWRVFRAKDPEKAEKIAQDMQYACDNNNIGYDQSQNRTLYDIVKNLGFNCKKVTTKCETDCAQLVRVCVRYAGIDVSDFYTATEASALLKTGAFEELKGSKYTESSDLLKRGDILVTRSKGHTVVVLSNGSKAVVAPSNGVVYAESFDKAIAGKYRITTDLYLRKAPVNGDEITVMKEGKIAQNYGYYTEVDGVKWLYVQYGNMTGFCSSRYLKKV